MEIITSPLWNFLSDFILCHNFFLFILLLLQIFKNENFKNESRNLIYTLNTILPFFSLTYILSFFIILFESWYGQNPYEWFLFSYSDNMFFFFVKLILPLAIGVLFFFKKLRLNYALIFIYLIAQHFTIIEVLLFRITMDYLPSSWEEYYDDAFSEFILKCVLSIVLTCLTYFLLFKKNKLPYPSIFLKSHVQ